MTMDLSKPLANGKRVVGMMAAMVIGTAAGPTEARAAQAPAAQTSAINEITRYCQACWRNARLPADRWGDCTQQVFTRLLENVTLEKWGSLLKAESEEKVEFLRAIDAVKKRTQRDRKHGELTMEVSDRRQGLEANLRDRRDSLKLAAAEVLSDRQQKIVAMSAEGYPVPEIADELGTTPERISDEKYKAIRKLRLHLRSDVDE
jgi:RNA polymerase sigma factor (sigma-70 family)